MNPNVEEKLLGYDEAHAVYYGPHCSGSPKIDKLAAALSACQAAMKAAAKDATNPHFKSSYADLASCWAAARPHLGGLSVMQPVTSSGKTVIVTTLLLHTSGQWLSSHFQLEARDATPQSLGSAVTYGRRYGFCAALGISADDDDDGNEASHEPPQRMARDDAPFTGHRPPAQHQQPRGYTGAANQVKWLENELGKRSIAEDFYPEIERRMMGRQATELDAVIKEALAQ
jgi:hypothetical protein